MTEITDKDIKFINDRIVPLLEKLKNGFPISSNKEYKLYNNISKILEDIENEKYDKVFDIDKLHEKIEYQENHWRKIL